MIIIDFTFFSFFRPGGIPARNHRGERLLLYLGVIDILQSYRMAKKLEHVFKAIIHDGVSAFCLSTFKVQLFWEGYKNLRNLPYGFDVY